AEQPAEDLFIVDQGQVFLSGDGNGDSYDKTGVGNGMVFGLFETSPSGTSRSETKAGGRNAAAPPYGHSAKTSVPSTIFVIARRQLLDLADLTPETTGNTLRQEAEEAVD